MAFDLMSRPLWRFPSVITEDEDWTGMPAQSGISISEDGKYVYVSAALPGVDEKDVDITFDKGILWLKGETQVEEKDKDRKYYRKAANSFSYQVTVPGDIDLNVDPEATSKNGIMTVKFAKSPQTQPKKITVKTGK